MDMASILLSTEGSVKNELSSDGGNETDEYNR